MARRRWKAHADGTLGEYYYSGAYCTGAMFANYGTWRRALGEALNRCRAFYG